MDGHQGMAGWLKRHAGGIGKVLAGAAPVALLIAATFGVVRIPAIAAERAVVIPAPTVDEKSAAASETAVFAGGCFWGVQGVFQHVEGVTGAVSGYAGGSQKDAVYETVGNGNTGHAEAVKVTFDPKVVSYGKLLQVFFSVAHNPTQLNYQGPDHGTQYRSALFPLTKEQEKVASAYMAELDGKKLFDGKIVTTLEGAKAFYPAEDYHQDFLTLNPRHPYIVYNDLPKIADLKRIFPDLYRDKPVLVMAGKRS